VTEFPEAAYYIAASRLRPGLDGGYTVAAMRRALDFDRHGGVVPTILTFEFAPDVDQLRQQFVELGLATPRTVMRNLYADLRANPAPLREFAVRQKPVAERVDGPVSGELSQTTALDSAGTPWRVTFTNPDGETLFTDYLDSDGRRLLRLPFISGRTDWHRADIAIEIFGANGDVVGRLEGFGALYRFWVERVISTSGFERNILISEAKQVGELLAIGPRSYELVHAVHNAHTQPPFAWDSPMDELWSGWFDQIENMDAVLWLTETQRADAVRRFGEHDNWIVVPHSMEPLTDPADPAKRELNRAVMLARLVDQKRVEDAIEAWPALLKRVPAATLDVYGDGPLREQLQSRIDKLGLAASVVLHGHVPGADAQLDTAATLLLTSRHEGQPLVILESMAHGCPVVAYDVHYGPADMIENGVTGALVEAGDRGALVDALVPILSDRTVNTAMSAAALEWSRTHSPAASMEILSRLFTELLNEHHHEAPVGASKTN
jgi:poly(glycerol-phosphate) alpha-glucosyltransferase